MIYIGASQPGWSWAHKPELESFPVEEAVQYGITTSDFASPVIILERFGITAEGEVVLLLGLAGTEDEGAVVLVIRKGE